MKKVLFILLGGVVFASCNSKSTSAKEATTDTSGTTAVAQKMVYPYTIDHPDNWEMGSNQNTMAALSALKAFENGNVDESLKNFGDSIQIQFDGLDTKLSNDSLKAFFAKSRSNIKNMNIKMDDWESVVSKDKKDEWVTLWYRQKWEDASGKKDSADIINDLKMKDGKIIRLDEYTRKLHQ
jgi:hypothetical protein